MHTRIRRRQNAVESAGMDVGHLRQPVVGQVPFEPDPIQIHQVRYHEHNLYSASAHVNRETRNNCAEPKTPPELPSARMDRAWLLKTLQALRQQAGSDLQLAKDIGLSHSGHVPKLLAEKGTTPSVGTCLHIASAAGVHPSDVLRAAGHGRVVPVLESAYRQAPPTIHHDSYTQSLLEVVGMLTDLEREEVRNFAAFVVTRREARQSADSPFMPSRRHGPARHRVAQKK